MLRRHMLRIAVSGATGRMGRAVVERCCATPEVRVSAACERAGAPGLGTDLGVVTGLGELGVELRESAKLDLGQSDVLIDFSLPQALVDIADSCRRARVALVSGTTGLDAAGQDCLRDLAREVAVLWSPNMSIGMNLCFALAEIAAATLGNEVDAEIIEAHHGAKRDAPSGTALRLGEVVCRARGLEHAKVAQHGRSGTALRRRAGELGYSVIRAGDIIGEHTLLLAGPGERVEITHRAASRATFAAGALRAAQWLHGRPAGRYEMREVLGLDRAPSRGT